MTVRIKKATRRVYIGNARLELESDVIDGQILDTKATISGTLCWVAGIDREKFINEFRDLITKYRI